MAASTSSMMSRWFEAMASRIAGSTRSSGSNGLCMPPTYTLEDDERFTTLDLTAKYFKPIWNARLRATATGRQAHPHPRPPRMRRHGRSWQPGHEGLQQLQLL